MIRFSGGSPGADRRPFIVTQRDLAEERALTFAAGEALQALEMKRKRIRELLEGGAPVEAGLRTAILQEARCEGYQVGPFVSRKLVVR